MIRHMVMFSLNYAPGSLQEKGFLRDAKTLSALPGVEAFQLLRQVNASTQYRFGMTMDFADRAAYDGYMEHPKHVKFLRDRWEREVSEFIELDCEPL